VNARRRFLTALATFALSAIGAQAQTTETTQVVTAPPDILLLVRQKFQFGKESARQKLDVAISKACDRIKVPNSWIDLESVTGKPERLSFDPFDSFAQIDDAFVGWAQIFASHPELARMQQELRALETNERTIIASRRSDLSYDAAIIDLSKARFMRMLEVRVRPGHEDDFVEAFKILRAAYTTTHAGLHWVVYQVNVGMPTPTFLAFVPMQAIGQNDDLLSLRGVLRDAEGEGADRMQQIARDAYLSSESNIYAISPQMSHVSKEFAAGDPDFWSPKPVASVEPPATNPATLASGENSSRMERRP
jgi:hypothetical protein